MESDLDYSTKGMEKVVPLLGASTVDNNVDAAITQNGETLSSALSQLSTMASFGRMDYLTTFPAQRRRR